MIRRFLYIILSVVNVLDEVRDRGGCEASRRLGVDVGDAGDALSSWLRMLPAEDVRRTMLSEISAPITRTCVNGRGHQLHLICTRSARAIIVVPGGVLL